ncbi:TPA: O-antigen ligase family protein [Streptococcus suis]
MIRFSEVKVLQFILVILPFIDTLNGFLNDGANESGISIGMIYRIVVLFFCVVMLIFRGIYRSDLYCLLLVILGIFLSLFSTATLDYLILLLKLLLPLLLVFLFKIYIGKGLLPTNFFEKLFNVWGILFISTILIPYFLGIGFNTYGEGAAGYKAFYYSQNDLGFILVLLFVYSLMNLDRKKNFKTIVVAVLTLFCGIILGLKSVYLIDFLFILIFLYEKRLTIPNIIKNLFYTIFGIGSVYIFFIFFSENILGILNRWEYFLKQSTSLISFLSSSRIDRLPRVFTWLAENNYHGLIFGTGLEYTKVTSAFVPQIQIEMDFFDVLFQIGVFGVCGIYSTYLGILVFYRVTRIDNLLFWVALCYSFLVGHVIESALSGMFFSAFIGLIIEKGKDINVI